MAKVFLIILFMVSIAMFVITATGAADSTNKEKRRPVSWQPIIGFNVPGMKAYIDVNSVTTVNIEKDGKYNTAVILMSYNYKTEATVGGKKIMIRGMAKSVMIECKSGITVQILDLFFKEPMPTRDSTAIAGLDYPPATAETLIPIDPRSILHNYLCPEYI